MTVAENISRLRKSQHLSLQELADRLAELGRPIGLSSLSRIERGERRVDADDLMALAIALDTAPTGILLPTDEPDALVSVTGARGSLALFWEWAMVNERGALGKDDRAFVARSIPWWLSAGADTNWPGAGTVALSMGIGDEDPVRVRTVEHFGTSGDG